MKIAIVGTGIAGLTTGWLLSNAGHDVTLLERMNRPGLSGHGADFSLADKELRADVPVRMFNAALWPNLTKLYRSIGVEIVAVEPSKSFGEIDESTKLRMKGSFFAANFWQWLLHKNTRKIVSDIRQMKSTVPEELARGNLGSVDFHTYLDQRQYSDPFRELFLFPSLAATVCTCSYNALRHYPARVILQAMLSLATFEPLFRARKGANDVVERLLAPITDVRYNSAVHEVTLRESQVRLKLANGDLVLSDHVVIATQANSALNFLPQLSLEEQGMLKSFDYENIEVVLHRDETLMPIQKRMWSDFNFLTNSMRDAAMCTVWMNRFCPDWDIETPIFQTITPIRPVNPEKLICVRRLQRPIISERSLNGLKQLAELHGQPGRRIWFCGSYASAGVPLLESGVVSSLAVLKALEVQLPAAFEIEG